MTAEVFWLVLGFTAQALFFLRFFVQWIQSERAGKSVVPVAFWYFSVLGGALLLVYAIHRLDPVFIVGQGCGLLRLVRSSSIFNMRAELTWRAGSTTGLIDSVTSFMVKRPGT